MQAESPDKAQSPNFKPPWWLRNGHSQTLFRKFNAPAEIRHRRERIELDDGDFIDLDWTSDFPLDPQSDQPLVLVIHGLCGCSRSPYVASLQYRLVVDGLPSVAMNLRGCSGEPNRLARTYHSGASSDLEAVYQSLLAQYPDRQIVSIGFSLGANVMLKWLGEYQPRQIRSAVAVSTPFDLAVCSKTMLRGMSSMYGRYFVNRLQASLKEKLEFLQQNQRYEELARLSDLNLPDRYASIWDFDDRVTAPLHGFADAAEYYRLSSSARYLGAIQSPTLLVQSSDDPLIPATIIPRPESLSSHVELLCTEAGGHVGFITGRRQTWLEDRITAFIKAEL